MFFTNTTFVGIDPTAGGTPITYAALGHDKAVLALGHGDLEEVLAFIAGLREAFVAISSPRRPNQGLMQREEVRQQLTPPPRPGRWFNFRMAEYQLRQHNISMPQTTSEENDCPAWIRMGFNLFKRLEGLDYQPYPHENASHQSMEAYPHACYTVLLGRVPFPKHSLEGRIQRQLILYETKLDVPDPMRVFEEITHHRLLQGILPLEDLYTVAELDALVSAYTAWLAANQPDQVTLLGNPEEGHLILPVSELKRRY